MTQRTLGLVSATILRAVKDGRRYGLDVMEATDLPDGTVYKTLHRMERRGLVRAHWEDAEIAEAERRPRRRYYEVTPEGEHAFALVVRRLQELARGTGLSPLRARRSGVSS